MFKIGFSHNSPSQIRLEMNDERLAIARRNVEYAKQLVRNGGLPRMVAAAEGAAPDDFGQRLSAAVKRITASRSRSHRHETATANDDESFAQKLARLTKARAASHSCCYKSRNKQAAIRV